MNKAGRFVCGADGVRDARAPIGATVRDAGSIAPTGRRRSRLYFTLEEGLIGRQPPMGPFTCVH